MIIESIANYGLSEKIKPTTMFSKVGLVGCGTVGQSLAKLIASSGIDVIFIEVSEEKISQAFCEIERELDRLIAHWGMTPGEKRIIISRIRGSVKFEDLKNCDLVIEAILSKSRELSMDIRKGVFINIERHVSPTAIIATNSTTISVTELSSELEHKDRCVSLHFMTTAPHARIVEVVKGIYTSEPVYESVYNFCKLLGKIVIPVDESPGLISVRMFSVLVNEACEILMEGTGAKEDIDITMKDGLGLAYGPFELADRAGLDKVERWMDNIYREFGDMKYKPNPLLKKLVRANQLGRKTRKGFYEYDETGRRISTSAIMKESRDI
jgi:3-hydroxybutyryl-CoA dehydrogenase